MNGFQNFHETRIAIGDVSLFVRHNEHAERPALLLLHGYPQTSAMWHQMAPLLSDRYHVICPDLRGYGQSDKPPSAPDHGPYSKRSMASDIVGLLDHFGHCDAFVCGHDRGGRVAHRLGLDHPNRVRAIVLLDIAPTREMYANTSDAFARAYWHWFFLILPTPFPENMIGRDPRDYWLSKNTRQAGGATPFHPDALEEYLTTFEHPDAIHATCEDYRAAATIDIAHDDADDGAKLSMPIRVLWARSGTIDRCFDPLALWKERANNVTGSAVDATHYMAEEIPDVITSELVAFFDTQG